jgi:hypothetical protein
MMRGDEVERAADNPPLARKLAPFGGAFIRLEFAQSEFTT